MKTKKKRNPSDLTKRNNDARKKEIAQIEARLEYPFPASDWRCWDLKIDTFADFDETNCNWGE